MGGSGCLEDDIEVGVRVEEVDEVHEVEGVAEVKSMSVEVNDEDEVLVQVFAGGLCDVGFGCRVVLLLSRHLLLVLGLEIQLMRDNSANTPHRPSLGPPTPTAPQKSSCPHPM
jgi:hypothetical protein